MTVGPLDPRDEDPDAALPGSGGSPGAGQAPLWSEEPPAPGRTRPLDMSRDPDRFRPGQDQAPAPGRTRPLDMSQDPDRFGPGAPDGPPLTGPASAGPLDPARDPDRYRPPGEGQSLLDLVGRERAFEEQRDGYTWIYGLVMVFGFMALVGWLFTNVFVP